MIIWNSTALSELWVSAMLDFQSQLSGVLEAYHADVNGAVGDLIEDAARELVSETKRSAPYAFHGENAKRRRHYRNSIAYKRDDSRGLSRCIWYVKGADYRLTHLLVHGHIARDGSRVKGDPFLQNACDKVFPKLEQSIEEAVKQ